MWPKKQPLAPRPSQAICVKELRRIGFPLVEKGWVLDINHEAVRNCPDHFMAVLPLPLEEVK